MKHIEGYVCAVKIDSPGFNHIELFGRLNPKDRNLSSFRLSDNLASNGLTPYQSFEEAVLAFDEIQEANRSDFLERSLAKITIDIPESQEDMRQLAEVGPYIVIMHGDLGLELQGAATEAAFPSSVPGAALVTNGLTPIDSFDSALYIRSEIQRKAWAKTDIARWQFSRLGEYIQPRLL